MFFPTNFDPTRFSRILVAAVILITPSISLKAKDWKRHEIFTGAHVPDSVKSVVIQEKVVFENNNMNTLKKFLMETSLRILEFMMVIK